MAQPAAIVEPLEPATLTDMLDGGWRLLHEQPGTILALSAVCLVPATVLSGLASAAVGSDVPSLLTLPGLGSTADDTGFPVAALLATALAAALRALGVLYLGVALTHVVTARQWGTRLGVKAAMAAALRRSGAVLGAWPLLAGGSVVSYATCFLPLSVWLTFTAVVAPVIASEGIGPIASIGRSMRLVARRFWMALAVVLLSSLVATVLTWILTLLPSALAEGLPWGARWAVDSVVAALAAMVTAGPLVTASVLLYLDLRVRTEGLDLRQRATVAFSRAG